MSTPYTLAAWYREVILKMSHMSLPLPDFFHNTEKCSKDSWGERVSTGLTQRWTLHIMIPTRQASCNHLFNSGIITIGVLTTLWLDLSPIPQVVTNRRHHKPLKISQWELFCKIHIDLYHCVWGGCLYI